MRTGNLAAIVRARRARWAIESEGLNCLVRHGHSINRNFGQGRDGLANPLATLNLFAFALYAVLDCVSALRRRCRDRAGTRRGFFEALRVLTQWLRFRCWTALSETMLRQRPPPGMPWAEPSDPS